ncbi:MAG TPA: UDP-glucose/GDP-mannose dehydrogenase family protein [Candidatus Saccharimonadales bacterium]|nr:UDP-glucose/GDP-mannose dehydrogenase family protein [Candidatus Saccharimonadales bacterium]
MQNSGESPKADEQKTVAVLGTGYVGVTTSAILANAGYKVYALDISDDRLQALREGRSFFYEEGINPLIKNAVDSGSLIPTASYEEAVSNSKFVFSCVGTPDRPDGSSNLDYVFAAAEECAKHVKPGSIYIQKSTVPVGTGRKVLEVFKDKDVAYTSNPEFLREGTAVLDTLFFDRIVVGGSDKQAVEQVLGLYKDVEENQKAIAELAGLKPKEIKGEYIATNLDSAELIKVTANAFLALKISFANSIAQLADKTEADVKEVMYATGADPRIGRAFLNAGRGYGGGCFPKDVKGLISSAQSFGVDLQIMKAADELNKQMPEYIVSKTSSKIGDFKDKKIAVLGLSFKAGTSDARKSPGVGIANILAETGAVVNAYDPEANNEAKEDLSDAVNVVSSSSDAVKGADAVFVATDWPEFKSMNLAELKTAMAGNVLVDCMNIYDANEASQPGLELIGVGRS